MSIDLNDNQYDSKGGKAIFNNGDAGLVNDVTVSITRKKPEEKEAAPAYKVTFTDEVGAEANSSFWYIDKATAYATIEELLKKQATIMKHIIHSIYGADVAIPALPSDPKGFLDGAMKYINEGLKSSGKFRVFANYGTPDYPKSFIQPRSWVPFMEPMSVEEGETRLVVGRTDNMVRLASDNPGTSGATAASSLTDDW